MLLHAKQKAVDSDYFLFFFLVFFFAPFRLVARFLVAFLRAVFFFVVFFFFRFLATVRPPYNRARFRDHVAAVPGWDPFDSGRSRDHNDHFTTALPSGRLCRIPMTT